ncbi:hypothetical protein F2P56_008654 [Juglans regia]|uniref:Alpha carbonic anhydrase 7-like n=2 Tax=Juglans regia TaxID=51240 RepID=A0A2I4E6B8_JUGRE|nr:alpha carbonic anhydrase 7-like [Juglans regia]KAF5471890.1 hypothetical protein F2P56_008654 [Juglans regia]
MNKYNISTIFSCWLLLFLSQHAICTTAQVSDEVEGEFEYDPGSERGPECWGFLREEWAKCRTGRRQSPINIVNSIVRTVPNRGQLKFNYKPANAIVRNSGHDIEIQWINGNAGSAQFNGVNYSLVQCHWHSPAEHLIDGRRYDLELHMVHTNSSGIVALVVAKLYRIGRTPDPFLSQFTEEIISLINQVGNRTAGVVDPRSARTDSANVYYNYLGSLTTPPCNETVIWIVNQTISTVAAEQVELLREAVFDYAEMNARPVQPLNGREILLYH